MAKRIAQLIKQIFVVLFLIGLALLALNVFQQGDACRAGGGESYTIRQGRTLIYGCRYPGK